MRAPSALPGGIGGAWPGLGGAGGGAGVPVLSPEGAELAGRLSIHVARTLSPVTSKLAPPEQRLLQTLLEQMLSPHDA